MGVLYPGGGGKHQEALVGNGDLHPFYLHKPPSAQLISSDLWQGFHGMSEERKGMALAHIVTAEPASSCSLPTLIPPCSLPSGILSLTPFHDVMMHCQKSSLAVQKLHTVLLLRAARAKGQRVLCVPLAHLACVGVG